MITKNDLISLLEEGIKIEESAVPIYSKHIKNTLFLSGFKSESNQAVADRLNELKDDSIKHRNMFLALIKRLKESDKDVY